MAGQGLDQPHACGIETWLAEQEKQRRQLWKNAFRNARPTFFVAAALFVAALVRTPSDIWATVLMMSSMAVAVSAIRFIDPLQKWRDRHSAELSSRVFARSGFSWAIDTPSEFLAPFEELGLLPEYERRLLHDYVTGSVGPVRVELTEAAFFIKNRENREIRKFLGLLIKYEASKPFSGVTVIRERSGFLGATPPRVAADRVYLEDKNFEDAFDVYSTDQVEARYLVTPLFMERMCLLRKVAYDFEALIADTRPIHAVFANGHLWIALDLQRGVFARPSIFADLRLNGDVDLFLADIGLIGDIAKILNLDAKTKV